MNRYMTVYDRSFPSSEEMFSHQSVSKKADSELYIDLLQSIKIDMCVFSSVPAEIMKVSIWSFFGFWSLLILCSLFIITNANINQNEEDDVNPLDVINYDPVTKRMRKPAMVTLKLFEKIWKLINVLQGLQNI